MAGCFSGDGTRVAVASDDAVDVFDVGTGVRIRTFEGGAAVALDRTGQRLLICPTFEGASELWDVQRGRRLRALEKRWNGFVKLAAFHPTQDWILTGGLEGACLWDAATGRPRFELEGADLPRTEEARFSSDGRRIVCWGRSTNGAVVWDAETGKVLSVLRGHEAGLCDACFDKDGERVLTASTDGTARVWSARDGSLIFRTARARRLGAGLRFSSGRPLGCHRWVRRVRARMGCSPWRTAVRPARARLAGHGSRVRFRRRPTPSLGSERRHRPLRHARGGAACGRPEVGTPAPHPIPPARGVPCEARSLKRRPQAGSREVAFGGHQVRPRRAGPRPARFLPAHILGSSQGSLPFPTSGLGPGGSRCSRRGEERGA